MGQAPAVILFLILSIILLKTGLLRGLDGTVDLGSFIFGISLFASITYIAFYVRVWLEGIRAFFRGRPAALNPGPSAAQILWNLILSNVRIAGVIGTATVSALWYIDRLDLAMQALGFIGGKMEKIVAALTH